MSIKPRTSTGHTAPVPGPSGHTKLTTARDRVSQPHQHSGVTHPSTAASPSSTAIGRSSGHRRAAPGTPVLRPTSGQGLPPGRVDAGGVRLRLRALHVMGHGAPRIARALGVRTTTIQQLVRADATTISPQLRDAIIDLYEAWWDKRAPERTSAERGAATIARRRAIAGNWCAAAALDDDQIDVPGYRPQYGWKPAAGTGIAPDIRPPARDLRNYA
jgi:hypothetical protein